MQDLNVMLEPVRALAGADRRVPAALAVAVGVLIPAG